CYLMLFNSRTENTDYVMIAPVIGYSLALAVNYKKKWEIIALSVCVCLIALNWQLSHFISPQNNVWLNPTVVLLYTVYLICQFGTGFRRGVDLSCL
ncbi:MAG: hypothetical protein NTU49_02545, partial [Gammaproteobacteria bacterium]|nr:hypothetical protein [Gammaproteobacteria bacterium]